MEENNRLSQPISPPGLSRSGPEAVEELLEKALACIGEELFSEAALIYRQVLKIEPGNIFACFNLAMLAHNNGEFTEAVSCYGRILAQEPDNFQVLCNLAHVYRDQGCLTEAIDVYKQAIKIELKHGDIHYNLGLLYYAQGNCAAAIQSYRQAIRLEQSKHQPFYNLAVIHFEQGDYGQALDCYQQALAICPDDIDIHFNMAIIRTRQGDYEVAADHYLQALALAPDDAELYNCLGLVFKQLKKFGSAETCYRQAIELRPDYGAAHTNLAVVMHNAGQIDQAIEYYSRAIALGHQVEPARYMLAALTGVDCESPPRDYVRNLFDSYADNYDRNLTEDLGYDSPRLFKEICGKLFGAEHHFARIADLGCGTGLVGSAIRDSGSYLVGVDLSGEMIGKAAEKNVYDELHCADIVDFLGEDDTLFDLVVAADVFIYLGDLLPFFQAVQGRIAADGHLLFTIEKNSGPGALRLQTSGRYCYSEDYLVTTAANHGLTVVYCQEVCLRKERGQWLTGSFFALRKN